MLPINDLNTFFAFLLVFVRCSAALGSSPLFGAQNTPIQVRVFTTVAISAAISMIVRPKIGPAPDDLGGLVLAVGLEAAAGLLIGYLLGLTLQFAQIAGAILDIQVGLSISQSLNPITGVSVSIISQFKYMLGMIIFLSINGHHLVVQAIIKSYNLTGTFNSGSRAKIFAGVMELLGHGFVIALQIAAPVLAVSLVVDAALGVMSKAVPQLQPIQIGMPAKIGLGLAALGFTLPGLVAGIQAGVEIASSQIGRIFGVS